MWRCSKTFANFIYTKVYNEEEYLKALVCLLNPIKTKVIHGENEYDVEFYPFDYDDWGEIFTFGKPFWSGVTLDDLRLKPQANEYPLVLCCSTNHSYISWVSLNDL